MLPEIVRNRRSFRVCSYPSYVRPCGEPCERKQSNARSYSNGDGLPASCQFGHRVYIPSLRTSLKVPEVATRLRIGCDECVFRLVVESKTPDRVSDAPNHQLTGGLRRNVLP